MLNPPTILSNLLPFQVAKKWERKEVYHRGVWLTVRISHALGARW
jgi:hypothetical protein